MKPEIVDTHALIFTPDAADDVPERARSAEDVMVTRSYRLPVELDQWIAQTAQEQGIRPSALVRDLLELGRFSYQDADRPVSMADILTALAGVRPRGAN